LNELIAICGDILCSKLTHTHIRDFIATQRKLPPNYSKNFPKQSPLDVAQKQHKKLMQPRSINDKIGYISVFFQWCIAQGFMDQDYAKGKKLPGAKPGKTTHEIYTPDLIVKAFAHPGFTNDPFPHDRPERFWLPILAMHTGARLAELIQLRCDNIKQLDSVWCMEIMPDEEDAASRLKTDNAQRVVPLHPFLLELKFPEYVEQCRKMKQHRIFENCVARNGKYGKDFSQYFNKFFRPQAGLAAKRQGMKLDFHSWRNTFINAAKQCGAETRMIEETVGHFDSTGAKQSMSMDYYAQAYSPKKRYEDMMIKVSFDVDLSHLLDHPIIKAIK
jgi:integrase